MKTIQAKQYVADSLQVPLEKAVALIIAGKVLINEQKIDKPGTSVPINATIRVLGEDCRYVGRGGLKLEGALKQFAVDPTGLPCLDIGASTGGFTDCLLQHGAHHVVAVDVGYNQIDWKLRNDPRVTVIEKKNFRYMTPEEYQKTTSVPISPAIVVIDVSFISLDKILPAVFPIAAAGAKIIALVKPQFEAKREDVPPGGIIADPALRQTILEKTKSTATALGFTVLSDMLSPITGTDGNVEFFVYLQKP
jgi:23S rRNA (cytidine1920-2'-O)/16S rRNA (cytidine1409-2'-O)-methyltransferase